MTIGVTQSSAQALKRLLVEAVSDEVRSWKVAQSEAARRLGTDRVGLNRMLQGRRTPSLEALLSYADAANMTFHFTLEGYSTAMTTESLVQT